MSVGGSDATSSARETFEVCVRDHDRPFRSNEASDRGRAEGSGERQLAVLGAELCGNQWNFTGFKGKFAPLVASGDP